MSDLYKIYGKYNILDATLNKVCILVKIKTIILWLLPFFMKQLLQLVGGSFLIELTNQTSLNRYYTGEQ